MNKQWYYLGFSFGYPDCCIESFCNGRTYATLTVHEKMEHDASVFAETGFIPCSECAKKDEREVLRAIDKRRHAAHDTFLPNIIR